MGPYMKGCYMFRWKKIFINVLPADDFIKPLNSFIAMRRESSNNDKKILRQGIRIQRISEHTPAEQACLPPPLCKI